jgi:signal transduction histidine kinase
VAEPATVIVWVSSPGSLPPQFVKALESQGVAARAHIGPTPPGEYAETIVRWCDTFVSSELAIATSLMSEGKAGAVVVVADGVPALPPEALRPGLLLVDSAAGPRTAATMAAAALVAARERASRESERARLDDVADAQENLVTIASHDLRTPISTLKLLYDLLRSGLSSATLPRGASKIDLDEMLDIFERNLEKMETFINDVLEASRLYRGRTEVRPESVSLNATVEDTIAGLFPVAMRKDIALDFVKGKGIPDISAERARASQVVTNLVGNALKYTPHGGSVTVSTRADGDGAVLEVADTGPGIADKDRDHIFKRFTRGSAQATGGEPSTGLGLFICRETVELYGGRIWFESEPSSGSRFMVWWPAAGARRAAGS